MVRGELVRDLARLVWGPAPPLVEPCECCYGGHGNEPLQTHALLHTHTHTHTVHPLGHTTTLRHWPYLAVVVLRFRCPCQEHTDVLGHLRHVGLCAIRVLHSTVLQLLFHPNLAAGEIRVVRLARAQCDARWWVPVPRQQREQVVLPVVTGFDDERQVRRVRAIVHRTRLLLIGIRCRQLVRGFAGAVKHLAIVVGPICDVQVRSHRLHFVLRVAHANQVAKCNAVQTEGTSHSQRIHANSSTQHHHEVLPVTRRADLRVHDVTAANAANHDVQYCKMNANDGGDATEPHTEVTTRTRQHQTWRTVPCGTTGMQLAPHDPRWCKPTHLIHC
jgi:hypothetical protein